MFLTSVPVPAAEMKAPNILYILTDDLGYGDVSCLNADSKIHTPHLDRLAKEGMIFTDAHANSAVCSPTRYGILTGRYAWRTHLREGVLWGFSPPLIPETRTTVASLLKAQGYDTAAIGKWHLGMDWPLLEQSTGPGYLFLKPKMDWSQPIKNGPTSNGFDSFYGISASLDMVPYCYIDNDRTVGTPSLLKSFWRDREGPASPDFEPENVLGEFGRRAVEFIAGRTAESRPFFLYLALNSPHTPIAPSKDFQGRSGISPYADFIIETDAVVGRIVEALEKAGLRENTLVVFTSDNGCSPEADFPHLAKFGHHPSYVFRGSKADIWEGGHRVPFLASWPAKIRPGSVCKDPICLTDLMATAAQITGAVLPENAGEDSVSILPDLLGTATGPVRTEVVHQSINGALSIREGKWKLEFCPGSGGWGKPHDEDAEKQGLPSLQLYDLETDIGETRNLQAHYPEVVSRLTAALETIIANGRSTPGAPQPNDVAVPLVPVRGR